MKLDWKPDRSSHVPIYLQIKEELKRRIEGGEWTVGTLLPSQRELANLLGVNRSTIVQVYEELMADGLVESVQGKGTKVVNNTWNVIAATSPDWQQYVSGGVFQPNKTYVQKINEAEFSEEVVRLGTGELAKGLLPVKQTEEVLASLSLEASHLSYEEAKGSLALREAVCEFVSKYGIHVSPSSVLIVSGALQALSLMTNGLFQAGARVAVESPSYLMSLRILTSANIRGVQVPLADVQHKPSVLRQYKRQQDVQMFYTIPTFHNPTNVTYSTAVRKELLHVCQAIQLPIIEDDVYRELWFDAAPPPPLKSLDQTGNVLYLGSMSKIISPGLRVGWVIGPEPVIHRLADMKMQTDYGASSISQAIAQRWLTNNDWFTSHAQFVRDKLKNQRNAMLQLLQEHMGELAEWNRPSGSFYIWCKLKHPVDMNRVFHRCLKDNVLIHPGTIYEGSKHSYIRLSYSYETGERLEYGIKALARVIHEMLA
ncbi:PLP-dependent aminotransferase family protein [Halalkalibacterium halodurans]|uniref:Transcriptional regulator (GntR family) n=1 Tax=Halalkalibacterium halodurans (strain ATCC BAA-125 / DSM 18197 / FERM 7344 / JCM 9153 / C-125) TaxID=272558 RepID=Q9KFP6_HALH5|nr:PLP-dependent aminotransferase family protein [Halalkalibacterium halodurans]MDY7220934.1 PLP-dependent aminotransferase family protein [Halalkalibacterium halodurans]MDY7240173.1 PLP-dependent aminotransferase family protein [Halalkalibacterium halodurans]MED3646503.1 PLP-dependent aminotransferase family protein [Halalkalibacterium halodurans]MED4125819.1 PLP-dependent aminotransferase family protein [Halalkalibacterium halodurans]MED4163170.1 PLP-dependent aminotransferase family protein